MSFVVSHTKRTQHPKLSWGFLRSRDALNKLFAGRRIDEPPSVGPAPAQFSIIRPSYPSWYWAMLGPKTWSSLRDLILSPKQIYYSSREEKENRNIKVLYCHINNSFRQSFSQILFHSLCNETTKPMWCPLNPGGGGVSASRGLLGVRERFFPLPCGKPVLAYWVYTDLHKLCSCQNPQDQGTEARKWVLLSHVPLSPVLPLPGPDPHSHLTPPSHSSTSLPVMSGRSDEPPA